MKPRQILLTLALAATLAAAFWPRPAAEVVGAVAKPGRAPAPVVVAQVTASVPASANALGPMNADLFPPQSWRPPPPPARGMVEPPPPPPMAPPLPFQYLGRWREGGKDVVFLAQGERVLQARVGEALAGWHLDQASDDALTFTWTALNLRQTLRITP